MGQTIYLDYNATTPCDPAVVAAMLPYFTEVFANPANGYHLLGRRAQRAVEDARDELARLIHADATEIIFTGGATESNNLAILGLARAAQGMGRNRLVTSAVEHKAVLLPCEDAAELGYETVILPTDASGVVSVDAAREAIDDRTLLVSLQLANNEVGTLQPVSAIAEIARQCGALVHTDAAQAVGKIDVDVEAIGVDLLSLSAHKFYGPKGVGALYMGPQAKLSGIRPLTFGGGQEKGMRAGTTNVPAIVGMGAAARLCREVLAAEGARIAGLRERLIALLRVKVQGVVINGEGAARLPNTISATFPDVEADALLFNLPEVMLGTGSACTSGAVEPSHVLQAMGLGRDAASSTIRISLGRFTTEEDVLNAADMMASAWHDLTSVVKGTQE